MKLSKKIKKEVKNWAQHSLYRLNAKSADCYAFSLYINKKGNVDFEGGWDWSCDIIDKEAEYLYIFKTDNFIKIKKEI